MRVLIVLAHPEARSFNHALASVAASSLREHGHEVAVSDLYAMRFNPISDRRNFRTVKNPSRFEQQVEELHASGIDGFAADLQTDMDKVAWCTALILQFPLWWLGMPAIMKGWVTASLPWDAHTEEGIRSTPASSPGSGPCAR